MVFNVGKVTALAHIIDNLQKSGINLPLGTIWNCIVIGGILLSIWSAISRRND